MSKDKAPLAIDFSKFTDEDLEAYDRGDTSALSDKALEAVADYEDKFNEISNQVKEGDKNFGITTTVAGGAGALATGLAPRASQKLVDVALPEDLRGGYKAPAAPVAAPKPNVAAAPGSDYFSPFGAGEGAVKNATHNVDEVLKNKVAQAAIQTPGYVAPGNSLILQPSSNLPPPVAPATGSPVLPGAVKPKVGMPQMRAALQSPNIAPANRLPSSIKGGAAAGFGANAIEEAQRGNYGDAATSALGSGSSIAAMASNPKLARAGKLGMAATILGKGYQALQGREEKAMGGPVGYAGGKAVKGGLEAVKKLAPAAGKARTLVEPTAEEIASFVAKPTKQGKFSDFIQNHMDEYLGVHQSDRLGTHGDYMGGTNFTNFQNINPLHAKNKVVWMNNDPNAANKIIKNTTYNDKPVIWTNYIGKENQHKSNRGIFNEILADVYKNNPDISEEQAMQIAARMKTLTGKDLDIRDKFLMQEIGGESFDSRGKLAEMFGLGFGRGKDKLVLSPNYQNILTESSEEFTKGAPTSAIGTRLHRVFDEPSQYSNKFHPDYDYTVHGEDMGVQFPAVPHTVLDWTQKYIKEGRGGKGSKIPHGNAWFNYMSDPQHINEDFVKRAQSEGFAAGGAAKKAAPRIMSAAKKLILPPAENASRTQIIGTLPTYEKASNILRQQGASGRGIDFGAGLGEGAKALGKDFDTYEPFAKNWTPTYSSAADVPSDAYGQLTNLNVLNVVPREVRDEIVQDIGRVMQPGGTGIITTRGKDVMNAKGLAGPEPMSVITSRDTYQKGFNKDELEEYLKYMLGDNFEIGRLNLGPAGAMIKKKAEGGLACMKEGGSTPAWQRAEGKNPEGGLNAAGRASYNRETGGNLKAPQPEGGPRKKSFCARMEGMKRKNTSSATAKDPDSRINKSLRKWKC
jgi:hypothetical protein